MKASVFMMLLREGVAFCLAAACFAVEQNLQRVAEKLAIKATTATDQLARSQQQQQHFADNTAATQAWQEKVRVRSPDSFSQSPPALQDHEEVQPHDSLSAYARVPRSARHSTTSSRAKSARPRHWRASSRRASVAVAGVAALGLVASRSAAATLLPRIGSPAPHDSRERITIVCLFMLQCRRGSVGHISGISASTSACRSHNAAQGRAKKI